VSHRGNNWVGALGMLAGAALLIVGLNKVATDPRISPLWRKIAQTAEGDVYQHIINGAIVTVLA
jgi:hypothetical protein